MSNENHDPKTGEFSSGGGSMADTHARMDSLSVKAQKTSAEFQAMIDKVKTDRAAWDQQINDILERKSGVVLQNGTKQVLLSKNTIGSAPYRITHFENGAPTGHFDVGSRGSLAKESFVFRQGGYKVK